MAPKERGAIQIKLHINLYIHIAVSYTHLDVYKRQEQEKGGRLSDNNSKV